MKVPESFKKRMEMLLKDEYDEFIKSYDLPKAQGIRVNTNKITIKDFKEICPFEILGQIPWEERGFYIEEEKPGKHPYHAAGLYYIQEPSAMSVVSTLGINKDDKVLDLCAAPGGKSTQAAGYLNGTGLLVSNEIEPKRARILSENIERFGITNAVVTNNSPAELVKYFSSYFDKIIVDAPCSGEGMFKKEDLAVEEWSPERVRGCAERQSDILNSASTMLKSGGFIVYSTCTFSIEENEGVISEFLDNHNDFEIVPIEKKYGFMSGFDIDNKGTLSGSVRLFPHRLRGEGHFIALLHKKNGEEESKKAIKSNVKPGDIRDYLNFCSENLNVMIDKNLYAVGDNLYNLPEGLCDIKGLRVLRSGIHLGEFKKNRFEPNHALALALKPDEAKNFINLSSKEDEIIAYLKGNTVEGAKEDGWCVIGVDGYCIGWGKASRGIIKNHYPKGLRW